MTFILRRYKVRGNSAGAVRAAMPPETATILASTGARAMQRITVRWASGEVANVNGTVRRATSEDVNAVVELDRAAPVGRERSTLLTARVESGEVIIFERDGRVLGYAVIRARSFFGRDFIELLCVSFSSRRSGVGSALLRRAVGMSSTERIFTSTNKSNAPMTGFLEKIGWRFSGELEGIDDGDPEMVYYQDATPDY